MTGKAGKPGRVLMVASECAPLVKTGGLADVVGALPLAMAAQGWQARVLLPAYRGLRERLEDAAEVMRIDALFGGAATLWAGRSAGLDLLLVDAPHLFDRPGSIYLGPDGKDWPDNARRFAGLSQVAAQVARGGLTDGWVPDILHLHDWQAGLAAAYLAGDSQRPGIVTTVHNIAFQGLCPAYMLGDLGLPSALYKAEGLEFYGQISALKAGLVYADALTTVSPTYAQELTSPEFGMGLEGVIAGRRQNLAGILNGIDTEAWNPATDTALVQTYSSANMKGKARCKAALQQECGLEADDGALLFGVVSRLTNQKGLDVLAQAFDAVSAGRAQLVVLGSGEAALEAEYQALAKRHPGLVAVRIGYDDALSHRIFGGCDAILVPSRFEPCGLTQLYGLRYGTLPVVSRTGGLADTVIDANPAAMSVGVATGIQFQPVSPAGMEAALLRALQLYADRKAWGRLVRNAMAQKVDWGPSAGLYGDLYRQLAN